jgi:hypothetical protein
MKLCSMVDRNQSQRNLFKAVKTEDYVKTFVSVHQTTKPRHTAVYMGFVVNTVALEQVPLQVLQIFRHCNSTNATY